MDNSYVTVNAAPLSRGTEQSATELIVKYLLSRIATVPPLSCSTPSPRLPLSYPFVAAAAAVSSLHEARRRPWPTGFSRGDLRVPDQPHPSSQCGTNKRQECLPREITPHNDFLKR